MSTRNPMTSMSLSRGVVRISTGARPKKKKILIPKAYLKMYLEYIVAEEKALTFAAWNYYDRVAREFKKAGLGWRNADEMTSCVKFLSQLRKSPLIQALVYCPIISKSWAHGSCHHQLIFVQQPPMRWLRDLELAEGFEAFAQAAKGLNFLPRYEIVKEFGLQLADREEADLFYSELLHAVGPAEHPLGNIAEAFQDAFEWSKRLIIC